MVNCLGVKAQLLKGFFWGHFVIFSRFVAFYFQDELMKSGKQLMTWVCGNYFATFPAE